MIKTILLGFMLMVSSISIGQHDNSISSISFVQILNDHKAEAVFYFQNNWKVLREMAINKNYIQSFQLLKTPFTEDAPFHIMLITTYADKAQYDLREDHFTELIEEKGPLKLMNDKKPNEFRKTLFSKKMVRNLN